MQSRGRTAVEGVRASLLELLGQADASVLMDTGPVDLHQMVGNQRACCAAPDTVLRRLVELPG